MRDKVNTEAPNCLFKYQEEGKGRGCVHTCLLKYFSEIRMSAHRREVLSLQQAKKTSLHYLPNVPHC